MRSPLWGNLTLTADTENGHTGEIHVPIYDVQSEIANWFLENTSPVPPEIESAWRRIGYEMRRHRQWAPVRVEGHRPVALPFDRVEFVPVSGNSFQ